MDSQENTADVVASAGLRRRRIVLSSLLVLLVAAAGALVSGVFFKSSLDAQAARAAAAEASAAKSLEALRTLEADRSELRGRVERYERENAELIALKTQLASDVAAKDEEIAKQNAAKAELEQKMKAEISSGEVTLSDDGGRLKVDLVDKVLFDSGEAAVTKRGADVLSKLGAVLAGVQGKVIQVSGHTDDSPPSAKVKEAFATNWELSTARATNVVRFLQDTGGISGKRLVATGYGQFRPIATNANPQGRAKNRRIEILLVPEIDAVRRDATAKAR